MFYETNKKDMDLFSRIAFTLAKGIEEKELSDDYGTEYYIKEFNAKNRARIIYNDKFEDYSLVEKEVKKYIYKNVLDLVIEDNRDYFLSENFTNHEIDKVIEFIKDKANVFSTSWLDIREDIIFMQANIKIESKGRIGAAKYFLVFFSNNNSKDNHYKYFLNEEADIEEALRFYDVESTEIDKNIIPFNIMDNNNKYVYERFTFREVIDDNCYIIRLYSYENDGL